MNNLLYAKYTITLLDLLEQDATFLDFMELDSTEHTEKFKRVFVARWGLYEIGGETPSQFKIFLKQDFDLHKDYYIDKINMYEFDFKLTDGIVTSIDTTITKTGQETKELENSIDSTNQNTNTITQSRTETPNLTINENVEGSTNETQYGLPNKETSNRYPTSKTEVGQENTKNTSQTGSVTTTGSDNGTTNDTFSQDLNESETKNNTENISDVKTMKGQIPTYEIKEKALATIRNIYEEFADRFKECFILLY